MRYELEGMELEQELYTDIVIDDVKKFELEL